MTTTQERIAILEVEIRYLRASADVQEAKATKMDAKLDELLELKSMSRGALWIVGLLGSSGLLGIIYYVSSWMKGDIL
jgi:hypothetical protein